MPPGESQNSPNPNTGVAAGNREVINRPLIDETVSAHLLQIFGNQSQQYAPTQAQVDKILALQEKGMDYTHNERTCFSPRQKTELTTYIIALIIMAAVFVFSVFYVPQYLGEIVSGMVGLTAGGVGGYGIGSRKKNNDE